jgi:hypothetical protein
MSFLTPNSLSGFQILQHLCIRQVTRSTTIWFTFISVLLATTACNNPPTSNITMTPQVVATYWLAELKGKLVEVDGCLRVNDRDSDTSYLLVWPADLAVAVKNDTVQIVIGTVTGNRKEVTLHIGEMVRLSGGETRQLDERLKPTVPERCPGPYWVVGNEISSLK